MSNHFSTIGLSVRNQQEFVALAKQIAEMGEPLPVKRGQYLCWRSDSGAELWLQENPEGQIIGLNPHFTGTSNLQLALVHVVQRPQDTTLDGAFYAWAEPNKDNPLHGTYPFVFDVPDFLLYPNLSLPLVVTAQIAAFARELQVYESETAYDRLQGGNFHFASRSFIPSGLFTPAGEKREPLQAMAIFTGHVLQCEQKANELTGNAFYWLSVETLGGVYDVVVDPQLVPEAPPIGGIISGTFWLSGRLTAYSELL
jgi:hypothetical protein